ncbi:hypothetical protein H920_20089 [Fukomys damarensis]|uniref:Uncharacterized protein n=1 Tax=Fukomys damarensis TaxID=885580 RepID=A0A091CN62_FUKDA|nr:hypothetical protein H920_20089 [Fukomys damarensis]
MRKHPVVLLPCGASVTHTITIVPMRGLQLIDTSFVFACLDCTEVNPRIPLAPDFQVHLCSAPFLLEPIVQLFLPAQCDSGLLWVCAGK